MLSVFLLLYFSTSSSSVSGNKGKRHCSNDTAPPSKKVKQEPLKLEEPESENGRYFEISLFAHIIVLHNVSTDAFLL